MYNVDKVSMAYINILNFIHTPKKKKGKSKGKYKEKPEEKRNIIFLVVFCLFVFFSQFSISGQINIFSLSSFVCYFVCVFGCISIFLVCCGKWK